MHYQKVYAYMLTYVLLLRSVPSMPELASLVQDLPIEPGVYLWKDETGKVLYVGKSKALRKRVSSYLRPKSRDRKTWELMQRACDLETIVTRSEKEALIVEATLIKKHMPPYNIALKDDKRNTWIRVDARSTIPTFEVTREFQQDGAQYFGPYRSSKRLERFLDTVRKFIPIAMCKEPDKVRRACMDYHLERCSGPCKNHIPLEEYCSLVEQMCFFLDGEAKSLLNLLEYQMKKSSEAMDFERAAEIRDRMTDIEIMMRKQGVYSPDGKNRDVLGISRTEEAALVELLIIRGGRLIGQDNFYFELDLDTPDDEVLLAFVEQYYFSLPQLPEEILLPQKIKRMKLMSKWLSETASKEVLLTRARTPEEDDLVEMANANAFRALRKILILDESEEEIVDNGVKELKEVLGLSRAPMHIEGFDIANIQGTDPTGSCVVFRNGEPYKKWYRMFKVRIKDTPDDYAMMREVVYRRYQGVLNRGHTLPDLILIDGGKGQLNVAIDALKSLGLEYLHVASLAKRDEILFMRGFPEGVELERDSPALRLVQRVRDESHRFAQKYHHKLREKRFSGSILEEVPGIGSKRRAALLKHFGSYDKVREASIDDILSVDGMTERSAQSLKDWIDKEDPLQ
ncbi:MAG: excinuclease ABC subunit UvrC [Candidatus Lokiarchaeota archaeon]|nr:excinuclease ABC subunit UvrC [Candidatus Lokiarchaeota archaeon]